MTEIQIDEQVARVAAWTDDDVAVLDLDGAGQALLEEIMSTPSLVSNTRRVPRLVAMTATAAAFVAAIAVPTYVAERDPRPSPATSASPYSSSAVAVARDNPRVLVGQPGWKIVHVADFEPDAGGITFARGTRELEVTWYPKASYAGYYRDREDVSRPERLEVLGKPGSVFRYSGRDFAVMLPPDGTVFVEMRGTGVDRAAFGELMGSLRQVDVDSWLAAMPQLVVKPGEQRVTVDRMLTDVPVPPGFDRAALEDGETTLDYYQFGVRVVGTVTCGWIDAWNKANAAGDQAGMRRAETAMAGSRQWNVLKKMDVEGDYPEVVWQVGDELGKADHRPIGEYFDCHGLR